MVLKPAEALPDPADDWICQRELAESLDVTEQTASLWAKQGKLRPFEHGITPCGHRKYSRSLLRRQVERGWAQAVERQDNAGSQGQPLAVTLGEAHD